ncbi:xylulokinase [Lentibacillus salicampi]|uniref:ATPase n=1 Tax=Lentibacillus salicampi TaxID=175306 RepID=A0A4Y9A959_9BACI|nr:FGGY-family carbohydrate kinase [Lentibacillus salicampi]TFJ92343.1 ATPase [Lentibacillus salicampi]
MEQKKLTLKRTALGIELGSTRIKAVLIGPDHTRIASGSYKWENRFKNGVWTYLLEDVWQGLQSAYLELIQEVKEKYGVELSEVGSIGISGMMHGYLPFDSAGRQLAPFRTWRNTSTKQAAETLTSRFQFNVPLRWSVAHLYQAMLNKEDHVKDIAFLTTLAGYVHWKLTGKKVLGVGEASGMFPIDPELAAYDSRMLGQFDDLVAPFGYKWSLKNMLPNVQTAGSEAGVLTEEGAALLDTTGALQAGILFCPPEGDAGTGMAATNSVTERTGNVSAGTSIFAMIVLEKALSNYYPEIDIVTTPTGKPVAMVHCNNFTSDINAWTGLFAELMTAYGVNVDTEELLTVLFQQAMKADPDVGGMVSCNYDSGEPITGLEEGRPLFSRMPNSKLSLPNFMRTQIYSALATLKIGMDILTKHEKIQLDSILGHGGYFKTEHVGQQLMADSLGVPVSVMKTAGEGGPWGMALLAAYSVNKQEKQSLEDYLSKEAFSSEEVKTIDPSREGMGNFAKYLVRYKEMLKVERKAVDRLK